MTDFDTECPRCANNKTSQPAAGNSTLTPSKIAFPAEGTAYVARNGTRYGPYRLEEINNHLKSGNILPSDQLLTDAREWVALQKVAGVILPPPASAPPPSAKRSFTPPIPGGTSANNTLFNQYPLSAELPEELKGFSWGAFFWTWIWGIAHNTYWPLIAFIIAFIPYVGKIGCFGIAIYLGIHGNELAWKNRKWESVEQFKTAQKKWALMALRVAIIFGVIAVILGIVVLLLAMSAPRA